MSEKSGSSRIITNKPRSASISDVRKLDAILSTLNNAPASTGSQGSPDEIYTQELSGVFLKRVPFTVPSVDHQGTVPTYDYIVENTRDYKVRVVMEFKGSNLKVSHGTHGRTLNQLSVEGVLARNATGTLANVSPADGKNDFSFAAEIKVFPDQEDIRVADLEGVKLYTTVTYNDMQTIMTFEAENHKEFDIEVELDLKGQLLEHTGKLPFTAVVPMGRRVALGTARSDVEVESAWKWQQVMDPSHVAPSAVADGKKIVQTSELKGVTLKQSMTPGDPTMIEFEVINGRDRKIAVAIDLEGDGYMNFRNQARPLTGEVFANQTAFIGLVEIRGDATVNWKYKEL